MTTAHVAVIVAASTFATCVAAQPAPETLVPIAAADFDAKFDGAVCVVWTRCGYYAHLTDVTVQGFGNLDHLDRL